MLLLSSRDIFSNFNNFRRLANETLQIIVATLKDTTLESGNVSMLKRKKARTRKSNSKLRFYFYLPKVVFGRAPELMYQESLDVMLLKLFVPVKTVLSTYRMRCAYLSVFSLVVEYPLGSCARWNINEVSVCARSTTMLCKGSVYFGMIK